MDPEMNAKFEAELNILKEFLSQEATSGQKEALDLTDEKAMDAWRVLEQLTIACD